MYLGTRPFIVIGLIVPACLWLAVPLSEAQEIRIEGVFPRQLPRGQATVINVAIPSRDPIQSAEISPSAGMKVSGIKAGQNFQGALTWSELTIDVAAEAVPGQRTLVLVLPKGRTAPVTITIPSHVPGISELRLMSTSPLEIEFSAVDASADLGGSPYVWFMFGCSGELVPGVVHGNVTTGDKGSMIVRAILPKPPATGKCDFQVRVSDSGGIESNTLKTTVDLRK
jgi:hypothetical protein